MPERFEFYSVKQFSDTSFVRTGLKMLGKNLCLFAGTTMMVNFRGYKSSYIRLRTLIKEGEGLHRNPTTVN